MQAVYGRRRSGKNKGDFPRETDHTQTIRSVDRDFEIKRCVIFVWMLIFQLNSGHCERLSQPVRINGKINDFLQPVVTNFHGKIRNCERKRTSFWKKRRISGIPYIRIAMRSNPSPNANPEYFSESYPTFS